MRQPLGAAALALLLAPLPALAQEGMEEAVEVLESETFLAALGACLSGPDQPAEVTMTVQVHESGGASLTKVEPMLLAETSTCMAGAVSALTFPASVAGTEITFAVPVEDLPVEQPGPADQPAPQPIAGVVWGSQPTSYVPMGWKPVYRSGRKKVAGGGVMVGLGGLFLLSSMGLLALIIQDSGDGGADLEGPLGGFIVLVTGSLVLIVVGSILIAVGRKRMKRALEMKATGHALAPIPSLVPMRSGGALLLTWRF